MERDILEKLNYIFQDVFNDRSIQINCNTTASDIEEWDSLTHIELIVAAEKYFDIRFKSIELEKLGNVGDLMDKIKEKLDT